MTEKTFYCTTCGKPKPLGDACEIRVKRGRGYIKIKRCSGCVALAKMSPAERQAASDKARDDVAAGKRYARTSVVEAPDV